MKNYLKTIGYIIFTSALAAAQAQSFPFKPLRLIVPFSPGGPADVAEIATTSAEEFSAMLKRDLAQWAKVIKDAGLRLN